MTTLGDLPERTEAAAAVVLHLADGPIVVSRERLAEAGHRAAAVLQANGVEPGDRVGLLGGNRPEWVEWAFGVWLAGGVLVPVQLPLRLRNEAAFRDRVASTIRAAGCSRVVVDPDLSGLVPDGLALRWDSSTSTTLDRQLVEPDSPAVVQFTSGSTANPRGAVVSHRAVMAQMKALGTYTGHSDVYTGWAPFFHDLGLFCFLVFPIANGLTTHVLPTELYARDPSAWLRLMDGTRSTGTFGPQSAWAAAFAAAQRRGVELDLSSVDVAWMAAESIDPAFVDSMRDLAPSVGLRTDAIGATYGLAEAVLGVTSSRRGESLRIQAFDRQALEGGRAAPVVEGAHRIASSGVPLDGMAVRVRTRTGEAEEGELGEIQVCSESLMTRYLAESGEDPIRDGWLSTGDQGFLFEGELYVTGRLKDMVIVMGQNYYPEDFEWAAGRLADIRPGRVVAFADAHQERVVLVCEPKDASAGLAERVKYRVGDAVGKAPDEVLLVLPGTIEKTTSGKLMRSHMRRLYAQDAFGSSVIDVSRS